MREHQESTECVEYFWCDGQSVVRWPAMHPLDSSHQAAEAEGIDQGVWKPVLQVHVADRREVHLYGLRL